MAFYYVVNFYWTPLSDIICVSSFWKLLVDPDLSNILVCLSFDLLEKLSKVYWTLCPMRNSSPSFFHLRSPILRKWQQRACL